MSFIGYGIVCLLLLLFVRGTMEKLHPIVQVLVYFILIAEIYRQLLRPIFTQLATSFTHIPYSQSILYSAFLLIINELIQAILEENEQEAIGQAVTLAVRASLISMWFVQLRPAIMQMTTLLQKLS